MVDNSDWVSQNLQRQRRMLEEKQKQRRLASPAVRAVPTTTVNKSQYSTDPLCYDGPLAFSRDPDSTGGATVVDVRAITPPNTSSPEEVSQSLATRLERADMSSLVASDDDELAVDPWKDGSELDAETLPTEIEPDYDNIQAEVENFVLNCAKKGCVYRCTISRDKKGMDKGIYPTYYLHLEKGDRSEKKKGIFLLAARKRKKSTTANYLISTDATDLSRDGSSFIAKVRSNAMGTVFNLYDNGANPKKSNTVEVRQELGAVLYDTNVLGFKGPRRMTVVIPGLYDPNISTSFKRTVIQPVDDKDTLVERFKRNRNNSDRDNSQIVVMQNKNPVWNEDSQSYVLNFHGRVTQASVKNFQVIHPLDPDYIVMQFGRISDEVFSMDFRFPLSAVQAFGIAMTSFHGKLACE